MTATSRTALAARIGATPRAVRAWEAGERAPRLAMRQKICAALGIPPYLLDADGARCPRCHRPWDG
jgi:transcriptional regulator with XRE-family HTH domain